MSLLFFLGLFIAGLMKHNLIIGSLPNYSSLCHVPGRDTRCARFSVGKPEVTSSPLRLWLCPSEGSLCKTQHCILSLAAAPQSLLLKRGCTLPAWTSSTRSFSWRSSPAFPVTRITRRVVMQPRFARCFEHHQRFVEASVLGRSLSLSNTSCSCFSSPLTSCC